MNKALRVFHGLVVYTRASIQPGNKTKIQLVFGLRLKIVAMRQLPALPGDPEPAFYL
jgi:hypothetical protein